MATLALKTIDFAAEKIPDKAFHAVPGGYFRPEGEENPLKKKKKREKRRQQNKKDDDSQNKQNNKDAQNDDDHDSRNHTSSDSRPSSESESSGDDEEQKVGSKTSSRRRNRRYQRSNDLDRGYKSDRGFKHDGHSSYTAARGPPQSMNYFPPPPRHAVDEDSVYSPEPYNPTKYAPSPSDRDNYYVNHPGERQPYNSATYQQPPFTSLQPATDTSQRSSSADRYRPAHYQPTPPIQTLDRYETQPYQSPQQSHAAAPYQPYAMLASTQSPYPAHSTQIATAPPRSSPVPREPSYMPPTLEPVHSPSPSRHQSRRHRSRSHTRDQSRHGRSGSRRNTGLREKMEQHKDVGASALGALAGGLLGSEFGKGKLSTIVGAALGGIGANMAEKKHEDDKRRKHRHSSRRYDDDRGYDSH